MNKRVLQAMGTSFYMQHMINDMLSFSIPNKLEIKPDNKMPLTLEEQATLDTLTGKAKKNYVKELRAKYE